MRLAVSRVIVWSVRLLSLAIALWWPVLWRDPVYTPRQVRMTDQRFKLPNGAEPKTDEERALAIFWAWERRTLVATHWIVGPYRGLRHWAGWEQTLLAMVVVWIVGSGILALCGWPGPTSPDSSQQRTGLRALLTTPLWRLLKR
jgi:hypothetical protein